VGEELAKAVITDIIQNAASDTECPMPRDIRQAVCARLDATVGEWRADDACPKCHGTSWVVVDRKDARCQCWARRPAPKHERMPDNPPQDLMEGIRRAAKGVVQ
jgi:hypothetical protein